MKLERYMVTGTRVTNSETVQGFLTFNGMGEALIEEINSLGTYEGFYIVETESIEPVALKPCHDGNLYACPNCNNIFLNGICKYCSECGQRLDLTEED